jgi:hypothetical protein
MQAGCGDHHNGRRGAGRGAGAGAGAGAGGGDPDRDRAARVGATSALLARLVLGKEYVATHSGGGSGNEARAHSRRLRVSQVVLGSLAAGTSPETIYRTVETILATLAPGLVPPLGAMLRAARDGKDSRDYMDDGGYGYGDGDDSAGGELAGGEADAVKLSRRQAQAARYRTRAAATARAGFEAATLEHELLRQGGSCDAPGCAQPASVLHFCGPNTGELLCGEHDRALHFDRVCSRRYTLVDWHPGDSGGDVDVPAAAAADGNSTLGSVDATAGNGGLVMRELDYNEVLRPGASVFVCDDTNSDSGSASGAAVWVCVGVSESDVVRRAVSYGTLLPAEGCPVCHGRQVQVVTVVTSTTRTVHVGTGRSYLASPPLKVRCVRKLFGSDTACGTEWALGDRLAAFAGSSSRGSGSGDGAADVAAAAGDATGGGDDGSLAHGAGLAAPTPFDRTF